MGYPSRQRPGLSASPTPPNAGCLPARSGESASLFPELAKRVAVAAKKVGLEDTPATFIANDPDANAMCIPWSSEGKDDFAVMLTSGLVHLLTPAELQFVIGHEIGHFIYRHFTYPAVGDEASLGERLATLNLPLKSVPTAWASWQPILSKTVTLP